MKIKIDSPALKWCGKNLFPFYIYQRIPMIILAKYGGGVLFDYPLLFMVIALIFTLVIILLYPKWEYKHIKKSPL